MVEAVGRSAYVQDTVWNPLDSEFHNHDHSIRLWTEALADLFGMCDRVHGSGSFASAKAPLDWNCS